MIENATEILMPDNNPEKKKKKKIGKGIQVLRQFDKDDNYLMHHGILGQEWGKRNGPPYPLDDAVSTGHRLKDKVSKTGKQHISDYKATHKTRKQRTAEINAVNKRNDYLRTTAQERALQMDPDELRKEKERLQNVKAYSQVSNDLFPHYDTPHDQSVKKAKKAASAVGKYTMDNIVTPRINDLLRNGWDKSQIRREFNELYMNPKNQELMTDNDYYENMSSDSRALYRDYVTSMTDKSNRVGMNRDRQEELYEDADKMLNTLYGLDYLASVSEQELYNNNYDDTYTQLKNTMGKETTSVEIKDDNGNTISSKIPKYTDEEIREAASKQAREDAKTQHKAYVAQRDAFAENTRKQIKGKSDAKTVIIEHSDDDGEAFFAMPRSQFLQMRIENYIESIN